MKYQKAHDQIYLNMAINRLNPGGVLMGYGRRVSNLDAVRLQSLPVRLFPCGVYYFEHFNRMFENQPPCDECVMVHNNYIGSVSAKVISFCYSYFYFRVRTRRAHLNSSNASITHLLLRSSKKH